MRRPAVAKPLLAAVAGLTMAAGAWNAGNAIGVFFARVEGVGLAVAGRAFKDGTAEVDVYADGKVTRYSFDEKGDRTVAACPLAYSIAAIKASRFSAAQAAASAAARAQKNEAEIRAVRFNSTGTRGEYLVATYDRNGKFTGIHRFESAEGRWEGYEDAIGERDPLDDARQGASGG